MEQFYNKHSTTEIVLLNHLFFTDHTHLSLKKRIKRKGEFNGICSTDPNKS